MNSSIYELEELLNDFVDWHRQTHQNVLENDELSTQEGDLIKYLLSILLNDELRTILILSGYNLDGYTPSTSVRRSSSLPLAVGEYLLIKHDLKVKVDTYSTINFSWFARNEDILKVMLNETSPDVILTINTQHFAIKKIITV